MMVAAGSSLGHYRIGSKLGEGGVGEVYRATDSRLQRDVALKVLSRRHAFDAQHLSRFRREARILAALDHPQIARIYDLVEENGTQALALELVEGETLAQRIERKAVPLKEAVAIALQLAQALEAAHEAGVVHRDLKPSNVMITRDGAVKVLDFGLAKAFEGGDPDPDAQTAALEETSPGLVLGTVGYMSPEQVRGARVDCRTDVWAFGAVLFEMLTGRRAFPGDTVSDRVARILERPPEWDRLPQWTPPWLGHLLRRCLEKDPRQRLQAIAEARILLEGGERFAPPALPEAGRARMWGRGAVLVLLSATLGFFSGRLGSPPGGSHLPYRVFPVVDAGGALIAAISPNGHHVAYIRRGSPRGDGAGPGRSLWVRDLESMNPRLLLAAPDLQDVFWSPDSRAIAYVRSDRLFWIAAAGGPSRQIGEFSGYLQGRVWREGEILLALAGKEFERGIYRFAPSGGQPELVLSPDPSRGEFDFHDLVPLPGDGGLLIKLHMHGGIDRIALQRDGSRRDVLVRPGRMLGRGLAYSAATGHLLYTEDAPNAGVWAVPYRDGATRGEPVLLAGGASDPSVADDGTLLYVSGASVKGYQAFWFDRSGNELGPIGRLFPDLRHPALSPDGKWLIASGDGPGLVLQSAERGTATPLSSPGSRHGQPAWSPDGSRIVFACSVQTAARHDMRLCVRSSDGRGEVRELFEHADAFEPHWSRDGRLILFQLRKGDDSDLWYLALDGASEPKLLLGTSAYEARPRLSPDGKFVAYMSDESGRFEVYVQPFPDGEGRWQISVDGGQHPLWSHAGDELFFVEGVYGAAALKVVRVSTEAGFQAGVPETLFTDLQVDAPLLLFNEYGYDVAADGRLVLVRRVLEGSPVVTVEQNWLAALGE